MKSKNLSEKILRSVKSKGFKYIELPSVIEANHILQRSGENFRKFMFSFTDINGKELCLRPDLTIASCLRYLENNLKGKEKIFYSGQAYRKVQSKKDKIIRNQIGFEINKLKISTFPIVNVPVVYFILCRASKDVFMISLSSFFSSFDPIISKPT